MDISKVCNHSLGELKGFLFNSYYTEVGGALLLSLDYSTLPWFPTLLAELSNVSSSIIFWLFGMTRSWIEPRSPGPLTNIRLTRSMGRSLYCHYSQVHSDWDWLYLLGLQLWETGTPTPMLDMSNTLRSSESDFSRWIVLAICLRMLKWKTFCPSWERQDYTKKYVELKPFYSCANKWDLVYLKYYLQSIRWETLG